MNRDSDSDSYSLETIHHDGSQPSGARLVLLLFLLPLTLLAFAVGDHVSRTLAESFLSVDQAARAGWAMGTIAAGVVVYFGARAMRRLDQPRVESDEVDDSDDDQFDDES